MSFGPFCFQGEGISNKKCFYYKVGIIVFKVHTAKKMFSFKMHHSKAQPKTSKSSERIALQGCIQKGHWFTKVKVNSMVSICRFHTDKPQSGGKVCSKFLVTRA